MNLEHLRKVRSGFLLDTNVISHLIGNKAPHPNVLRFFEAVDEDEMYLSVVTLGEIQKGIDLIPISPGNPDDSGSQRRWTLNQRFEAMIERFGERIVSINAKVARKCGELQALTQQHGYTTSMSDTLIAATAYIRDFVVISNDKDFRAFSHWLIIRNPLDDSEEEHTIT